MKSNNTQAGKSQNDAKIYFPQSVILLQVKRTNKHQKYNMSATEISRNKAKCVFNVIKIQMLRGVHLSPDSPDAAKHQRQDLPVCVCVCVTDYSYCIAHIQIYT